MSVVPSMEPETSTSRAPNQSTITATPVPTVSVMGIASWESRVTLIIPFA